MDERTAYRIFEICRRNGIGRSKVYEEIAAGRLKAKKNGKLTLITAKAEAEWLEAMPALESGQVLEELAASPKEDWGEIADLANRFVAAIAKLPARRRERLVENFNDLLINK
jgi:excisionase family DNA binding protein